MCDWMKNHTLQGFKNYKRNSNITNEKVVKMTCLVLIITPIMILLAADNAVTLDERIYGEAQKIFRLSNNPPLAMMIYNSSDFCEIPLENIISEYIKKTDFNRINTPLKVKRDFLQYIHKTLKKENIDKYLNDELSNFKKEVETLNSEAIQYYSTQEIKNEILPLFLNYQFDFTNETPQELSQEQKELFNKNMNNEFLSKISEETSGIVISGFDKETLKGSYCAFEMIANTGKKVEITNEIEEINVKKNTIKIFAQSDVIESFFNGIDETLIQDISENINYYVNQTIEYILNCAEDKKTISDSDLKKIRENFELIKENPMMKDNFMSDIETLKDNIMENILYEIEGMPKKELLNMAKSLIKITRLKRILSSERVTVGEEVTSYVLTLKDGVEIYKENEY